MTQDRKRPQLNNRGFSLVELLVTVAIMGVLVGILATSFYLVSKSNVKKAANAVNDALTLCREKAMTNSATEWDVVISGDKVEVVKLSYQDNETGENGEQILTSTSYSTTALPSNAVMSLVIDDTEYKVENDNSVSISFKQNGEVGIIRYYNSNAAVSSATLTTGVLYSSSVKVNKSYCYVNATHKSKVNSVILYYATGKHGVED